MVMYVTCLRLSGSLFTSGGHDGGAHKGCDQMERKEGAAWGQGTEEHGGERKETC